MYVPIPLRISLNWACLHCFSTSHESTFRCTKMHTQLPLQIGVKERTRQAYWRVNHREIRPASVNTKNTADRQLTSWKWATAVHGRYDFSFKKGARRPQKTRKEEGV